MICLVCLLVASNSYAEQSIQFSSLNKNTSLIELFSSQGCSSCPPAESWISQFVDSESLWQDFVPIVFHVDYWDYLGWKDPFSSAENSQRQRDYYKQGKVSSVYTPGFIVNGHEWRGWFRKGTLPELFKDRGELKAVLKGKELHVSYSEDKYLELNISILGIGLKTAIKSGENSNKNVIENFVSLVHQKHKSNNGQWNIELPSTNRNAEKYGIAIWVSKPGDEKPLQVVGGWLPK